MTKEQLEAKRENLAKGIEQMRQQATELEVAIRRNEGALLMVDHLIAEMNGEEGADADADA